MDKYIFIFFMKINAPGRQQPILSGKCHTLNNSTRQNVRPEFYRDTPIVFGHKKTPIMFGGNLCDTLLFMC